MHIVISCMALRLTTFSKSGGQTLCSPYLCLCLSLSGIVKGFPWDVIGIVGYDVFRRAVVEIPLSTQHPPTRASGSVDTSHTSSCRQLASHHAKNAQSNLALNEASMSVPSQIVAATNGSRQKSHVTVGEGSSAVLQSATQPSSSGGGLQIGPASCSRTSLATAVHDSSCSSPQQTISAESAGSRSRSSSSSTTSSSHDAGCGAVQTTMRIRNPAVSRLYSKEYVWHEVFMVR